MSMSVHVIGLKWELKLSGSRRIAATSPTILDTALGERLDVSLTACEDVVVAISSILETAM